MVAYGIDSGAYGIQSQTTKKKKVSENNGHCIIIHTVVWYEIDGTIWCSIVLGI